MEQKNSQERDRDQKNRAESQGFKSDGVNEKKVLNLENKWNQGRAVRKFPVHVRPSSFNVEACD